MKNLVKFSEFAKANEQYKNVIVNAKSARKESVSQTGAIKIMFKFKNEGYGEALKLIFGHDITQAEFEKFMRHCNKGENLHENCYLTNKKGQKVIGRVGTKTVDGKKINVLREIHTWTPMIIIELLLTSVEYKYQDYLSEKNAENVA